MAGAIQIAEKMAGNDPRFSRINELFINYSLGNFGYKIEVSPKLDEIDAFISNINMLGEELKATTISRDYFNNIFNSVSDAIFIIGKNGKFRDLNKTGLELLKFPDHEYHSINFFRLFKNRKDRIIFQKQIKVAGSVINMKAKLKDKTGRVVECMISANQIKDRGAGIDGYQGTIKDITKQQEMDNLVIRTIIDTQEKERNRVAVDLHDSLGHQLSGIMFLLGTLKSEHRLNSGQSKATFGKATEALQQLLLEVRNICFNLMPRTLENYGLAHAIPELCKKTEQSGLIDFKVSIDKKFPSLDKSLEIALFRIVQEFINNTIKYAEAKRIIIEMKKIQNNVTMFLKDNGKGFNLKKIKNSDGMGLKNVQSRVESYNGEVKIESAARKGTSYIIIIPIK